MPIIDELKLSKELIRFPSVTPVDAGAIKFLSKKLILILHIVTFWNVDDANSR